MTRVVTGVELGAKYFDIYYVRLVYEGTPSVARVGVTVTIFLF